MFTKLLIANRGEIAQRIIFTVHRLGVRTVAVVSEADRGAPYAGYAGEVVEIGPGPAADAPEGHGIVGMYERAILVGGTLRSGRGERGGFKVEAVLPLRNHDA